MQQNAVKKDRNSDDQYHLFHKFFKMAKANNLHKTNSLNKKNVEVSQYS